MRRSTATAGYPRPSAGRPRTAAQKRSRPMTDQPERLPADPRQPDLPPESRMPDKPAQLGGRGWLATLKRTVKEFQNDNLTDWAAALTYYGVLSIFPGIIVLLSVFSLVSDENTATRAVDEVAPDRYADTINNFIGTLRDAQSSAGLLAVVAALGALWSASGYVGAFM